MVKLMDNTVIHEIYSSVKQAFFTVQVFVLYSMYVNMDQHLHCEHTIHKF